MLTPSSGAVVGVAGRLAVVGHWNLLGELGSYVVTGLPQREKPKTGQQKQISVFCVSLGSHVTGVIRAAQN